jgi:DNA topoisomerase-1
VQSVAVRLIVQREREVTSFMESSSFKISAEFKLDGNVILVAELKDKVPNEASAMKFLESCLGANYKINSLETKPGKRSPAAPFTTSTLQQEASRKLGFSVAQTMRVAQTLYEAGHISYMRTDSVNLSDFAVGQAKEVVTKLYGAEYSRVRKYQNKVASAQEAHEAIRPTDMFNQAVPGERNEQRLYELIWKRTIASQMEDAVLERTTATIGISTTKQEFVATGEVIRFEGFLKVYLEGRDDESDEEEGKNGMLPPLTVGQNLNLIRINAKERFAKHPPRYTEASLVKKLEELGIGRPSTFAPTISTIQKREYVVRDNRDGEERGIALLTLADDKITTKQGKETVGAEKSKLFPTDLGMLVTDFLIEYFPSVLDFSFTAKVEEEFDEIANGHLVWNDMIAGFWGDFSEKVQTTKDEAKRVSKERILGQHPQTGEDIIAKFGKFGPFVQVGVAEGTTKPRYASLRADQRLDTITLADAMELFKLPRVLGEMEGNDIRANIGRFGPYIQLGKEFFSIPKGEDAYSVTLERAVQIIDDKRNAEKNKVIKEFGPDIQVLNGRFGPYIKMNGANVKIPKDKKAEELTLEECNALFESQKDKPKKKPVKRK